MVDTLPSHASVAVSGGAGMKLAHAVEHGPTPTISCAFGYRVGKLLAMGQAHAPLKDGSRMKG
jgi:hypothetical protein